MKTTIKILSVLLLLMCTLSTIAQDSTLYKVKLEKFQTKARNGKIVTLVGTGAIVVGVIGFFIGNVSVTTPNGSGSMTGPRSDALLYAGGGLAFAGTIATIPGIINWSVGKKKVKEYQIRLDDLRSGFYYGPSQVGFKLAFKF